MPKVKGAGVSFNEATGKQMWVSTAKGFFWFGKEEKKPKKDSSGDTYEQDQEYGPDIKVHLPMGIQAGSGTYVLDLTDLTYDEYLNLRKILATALKEAEPIIKKRDADAAEKLQSGQVAAARAYRAISRLFTPEGEVK